MSNMTPRSRQVSRALSVISNPPPSPPMSSSSSDCGADLEEEVKATIPEPSSEKRRTSTMTELSAAISAMPSELEIEIESREEAPYTPMKVRPALMESNLTSGRWSGRSGTPTRKSYVDGLETPRSTRSQSMVKIVPRSRQGTPSMEIGTPQRDKRDYPLVLLHVTLLPTLCPYSPESMQAVLPEHILENFRVLQTRMGDTTILGRGVLIQHPRNEYELLEEHLLESLDLLSPRILKCGHFCDDSDESDDEHMGSRRSSLGPNSDSEASEDEGCNLCGDCQSPIKRPQQGVGKGKRRWEVKIFAANGLMRSGAWSAAWSEQHQPHR